LVAAAVFFAAGFTAQAASTKSRIYSAPAGIAADCSRDATRQLTAWIRSVPSHAVLSFERGACYRIDGTVVVNNRRDLTFDGHGVTFRAEGEGDQARRHFWFIGGGPYVIRDVNLLGADPHATAHQATYVPERAFQHGFAFQGVSGAILDHVHVRGVYGDFVYIGSGGGAQWSHNIRITRSTFQGAGRQGISIVGGRDIAIEHNTIEGVGRSLFDLEPNGAADGAVDIRIANNVTGAAHNFWLASKGDGGAQIRNIQVVRNRAVAATGNLIWVSGGVFRGPLTVENNNFRFDSTVHDDRSRGAFYFARCAGITVRANHAAFPASQNVPAVEIRSSERVNVQDNTFPNAGPALLDTTSK